MKFNSKAIHSGFDPEPTTGAIMPPIFMTSTFVQEEPGQTKGYDYTRAGNPNFTYLERTLAALEKGRYATAFSSGLGALTSLMMTFEKGTKIVAVEGLYGGTYRLFTRVLSKFGMEFTFVPTSEVASALEDVRPALLIFETPTNPLLTVSDIEELCELAKEYGAYSLVDNTFATPYYQNPLELGADLVLHSTTKYIGGHSDVVGGAIITNSEEWKQKLDFSRLCIGTNPSPFDTWLTLRGVKTLGLRMAQHGKSAQALAEFFKGHPHVREVYYPGFGGMVSAEFAFDLETTKQMISSYKLFALAESLGGVESLVCHPASMTHASIPPEERARIGLADGLVRYSTGIEETEDLLADIEHALSASLARA